jgi:hypothetical protein
LIDGLYGLSPSEFTSARDQAVRELRAEGRRTEAAQVKELRKPTVAAGAVNRLVREHRADVNRFLAAADGLRKAQLGGGDVAKATRLEREALDRLVRAGGDQVRQSLQAAAVDAEAAERLLEGKLEHELEPRGFGTLLLEAPPAPRQSRKSAPAKPAPKPDTRATRARLHEATRALVDARAREREAERGWRRAEAELRKAEAAVAQAEKELEEMSS